MTRGRKKDHTAPLTKALIMQRDYRARKAQSISDLETRCRAAEQENVRLRHELALARAGVPSLFGAGTTEATTELMRNLAAASASLAQFQRLAFPAPTPGNAAPTTANNQSGAWPSPASLPTQTLSYIQGGPGNADVPSSNREHHTSPPRMPSPSPSLESECCGGYIDCRELVEAEGGHGTQGLERNTVVMMQTSGIRSTSDDAASAAASWPARPHCPTSLR